MTNCGKAKETRQEGAQEFIRDVFPAEMDEIIKRRDFLKEPSLPALDGQKSPSSNYDLVGLALSGGGIRSTTLNLGILQGMTLIASRSKMDRTTMLRFFDYLSTVSGGGYIGSWLSAWILRSDPAGDPQKSFLSVEEKLKGLVAQNGSHDGTAEAVSKKAEAPQIDQLRKFSNYLTPKLGLFSVDTWTLIATYGRNFLLNQIILFAALTALLLVPQGFVRLLQLGDYPGGVLALLGALALVAGLIAVWWIALGLNALADIAKQTASLPAGHKKKAAFTPLKLHCWICSPLLVAAVLLVSVFAIVAAGAAQMQQTEGFKTLIAGVFPGPSDNPGGPLLFVWALAFAVFNLTGYIVSALWIWSRATAIPPKTNAQPRGVMLKSMAIALVTGAVGGALLFLFFYTGVQHWNWQNNPWDVLTWGVPGALIIFLLSMTLSIALRQRLDADMTREWLASVGAWVLIYAVSWVALFVLSFYAPLGWQLLGNWFRTEAALVGAWLLSTGLGLFFAKSSETGTPNQSSWRETAAKVLPVFALMGLLMFLSTSVHKIVHSSDPSSDHPSAAQESRQQVTAGDVRISLNVQVGESPLTWQKRVNKYWDQFRAETHKSKNTTQQESTTNEFHEESKTILFLFVGCVVLAGLMAWFVNINEFSMHGFYRNRLVRAFLGASGARRNEPITGLDPGDDVPLSALCNKTGPGYAGPYHIINTALNLTDGKNLAWQERKASSFVFTPRYCGSEETRYRPTKEFAEDITLGTTMTISGAAVSPNSGYHSNNISAFFLSIFNARLGWWAGNPKNDSGQPWKNRAPSFSFWYLLCELFGKTSDQSKYLYLSDGGHFENLGLYELVRRRCKYIVCSDAGADPRSGFEDLGNAIRKIRADMGIDIEIDLTMLRSVGNGPHSQWHHAVGKICYDKVEQEASAGVLIYIKASLTGDEPADVLEYAGAHPEFPHETTLDQFFSESQFEAYRRLGEHIAWEIFRYGQPLLKEGATDFFYELCSRWKPLPPTIKDSFLKEADAYLQLESMLLENPDLAPYDEEIYKEGRILLDGASKTKTASPLSRILAEAAQFVSAPQSAHRNPRAALHFCVAQLQFMQNVFIALRLDEYHTHPLNKGWMNMFRRWTATDTLRKLWPALKAGCSQDFVDFAEYQLNLTSKPKFDVFTSGTLPASIKETVLREFEQEWPEEPRLKKALEGKDARIFAAFSSHQAHLRPNGHALFPYAVAVVTPSEPDLDLILWVRGCYRNSGLGTSLLKDVIDKLRTDGNHKNVKVYLPEVLPDKPGSMQEKDGWVRFYGRQGFVVTPSTPSGRSVLKWSEQTQPQPH